MLVKFQTNIDIAKQFMGGISGLPLTSINPAIGDLVRVYHDSDLTIFMRVVERHWIMTNGSSPYLECYLDTTFVNETILDFTRRLWAANFR